MSLDRAELQDSARRMFGEGGLAPQRAANWGLIAEMGWLGLAVPEELGGLGQGRPALCTLYYELGRVLAPSPVIPQLLAIEAVGKAEGFAGQEAWIERLVGGELATTALSSASLVTERTDAGGYRLTGAVSAVPEADEAAHLLVWSGELCALVPLAGLEIQPRQVWDPSRRLFDVRLADVEIGPELVLAEGAAAHELAENLKTHLRFALAADSLGGAAAALEMTVEYLKTRKQFGRPLAMFQALQHRCADLRTLIAAAEALLWKRADEDEVSVVQAGGLKSYAASVFHAVTEEMIQLHGGIGLTAEHPCHLFMKRALLSEALGDTADTLDAAVGAEALARLGRAAA